MDDKFLSIHILNSDFVQRDSLVGKGEILSVNGMEISSNGAYFYQIATEAANNGEKRLALESIEKVLATDPKYSMAWHVKGNCLDELGRCDEALKCYEHALHLDPYNAETWFNKGITLKKLGREREADTCMTRAVRLALGE